MANIHVHIYYYYYFQSSVDIFTTVQPWNITIDISVRYLSAIKKKSFFARNLLDQGQLPILRKKLLRRWAIFIFCSCVKNTRCWKMQIAVSIKLSKHRTISISASHANGCGSFGIGDRWTAFRFENLLLHCCNTSKSYLSLRNVLTTQIFTQLNGKTRMYVFLTSKNKIFFLN